MAIKTKKTYYALRILLACGIFYFSLVGKSYAASTDCTAAVHDTLDHAGTFTLAANVDGVGCVITADNVIIDGQGLYSINTVSGSATAEGHDGYDFTIQNVTDVSGGITSNGFNATHLDSNGSNGGNITLINSSIRSNISSNGGSSVYGSGGTGGTITITHSGVMAVRALGGNTTAATATNGGVGGTVTIQTGSTISDEINVIGGSSKEGVGGLGGTINVTDSTTTNSMTASGGYAFNGTSAGNGGSIVVTNSHINSAAANGGDSKIKRSGTGGTITLSDSSTSTGALTTNGGTANNIGGTGLAGFGGDITIDGSTSNGSIISLGGYSSANNGGNGGDVIITNSSHATTVSVGGGDAGAQRAGDSGSISVAESSVVTGLMIATGGISYGSGSGGIGGNVIIQNSNVQNINALGGVSSEGYFGSGGNITIVSSIVNNINANGGGDSNYSSYARNGGNGGTIIINGDSVANNVSVVGGATYYGTGGNGGSVTVQSSSLNYGYLAGGYSFDDDGGVGGTLILESSTIYGGYASGGMTSYGTGGAGGTITLTNSESTYALATDGATSAHGATGNGGNITLTNSDAVNVDTTGTTVGTLTITDTPPTVTLVGDASIALAYSDIYTEQGATASDTKYEVTDLTSSIVTTGTVDAAAGVYEIDYSATDDGTLPVYNGVQLVGGGTDEGVAPQTTTVTRTVTRAAGPSTHHTTTGSYSPGFGPARTVTTTPATPAAQTFTFTKNLKFLQIDNEIKELQKFLNTHGYPVATTGAGSLGNETTKFGSLTQKALIKFQKANKITPAVGYFGPITRALVNSLNK